MRITKYRTELNDNLHNVLVKETSCNYSAEKLDNPRVIVDMLNTLYNLNRQAEEHVYMIALNTKCKVLGVFEISHGTVNQAICNPRDIFVKALLCGATNIVIAHNHPSQDVTPSNEDIKIYNRIKEAGNILGIALIDNIIVGNGYYSFNDNGI